MLDVGEDERTTNARRRRRRRWRFGTVLFDEANWSLLVDGNPVAIESKPLELLHELCLRAGEVVSKDDLLETVWNGVSVVENSVPTAVAKLRRALGRENEDAVMTVARIGYRLAVPVAIETLSVPVAPRFAFAAGDAVPGRPQWRMVEALGDSGAADVWRGRHEKTGEIRIFKFADAPDRLRALKREAALSRLLLAALGPDGPFVALLEWNFATAPYFLESRDAGLSLLDWATAAGGLGAIADERRLEIAARCARALAAVHGIGVLHKDIKPANILVESIGGALRVRLADFGNSRVIDDAVHAAYAITDLADEPSSDGERLSGTPFYRAPELTAGEVPSVKSDIYSLGLVLFQLAVGDFGRVPAPGWESEIDDPLLRGDIAIAAAGDPAARIDSANALADRLDTLDQRRAKAASDAASTARLDMLAKAEARRRARQPWVRAAVGAALLGIVGTSTSAVIAVRQRNEALRQEHVAQASYDFLANDLLARSDPYLAGTADETIVAASRRASKEIDRRFVGAPLIAGRLHHSLARAFDQRSDLAAGREEYGKADHDFAVAGLSGACERRIVRAQWAQLEALSGDPSRLPFAHRLLASARAGAGAGRDDGELAVWLLSSAGSVALASEDVRAAQAAFRQASARANTLPAAFDARQRLNLRQRVAFTYLRLGDGASAAALLKPLLVAFTRLEGVDHPDTLNIRLNIVQAFLTQKRFDDVIADAATLLPLMEHAFGPDHRRTLQLLAVRQQALGSVERYAEAAADGERVWRATTSHEGPAAFQAVAGRADTAETQCRAGQYGKGLANARAALAIARMPSGPETALAMAVRTTVASCLIAAGRPLEARPLLAGIDRAKVTELVGDSAWAAGLDLALAQVLLAGGDVVAARAHLAASVETFDGGADAYSKRRIVQMTRELDRRRPMI